MATFFSGAIVDYWSLANNYIYGTLTGDVIRSGNTVTLTNMTLALSSRFTSYGTDNMYFIVNGTRTDFYVNAGSGTTNLGSYSLSSTSFSVGTSDTSATVSWVGNTGTYSGSFNVSFPAGGTAPAGTEYGISLLHPYDATILYHAYSDGGTTLTKYLEYSLNGTDWTVFETIANGAEANGSFFVAGLSPETAYTLRLRTRNSVGSVATSLTFSTPKIQTVTVPVFYGSLSGVARRISGFYCPENGKAKATSTIYGSDNDESVVIFMGEA